MKYLCLKLYYHLNQQNAVFRKLHGIIQDKELASSFHFYNLEFEYSPCVRIILNYTENDSSAIFSKFQTFLKTHEKLSVLKLKRIDYIRDKKKLGGAESLALFEQISTLASKACLKILFYDDNFEYYFSTVISAVIVNYITVRNFYSIPDSYLFFKQNLGNSPEKVRQDTCYDFRFSFDDICTAIDETDLKEIFELIETNHIDICDVLEEYIDNCKLIKADLFKLNDEGRLFFCEQLYSSFGKSSNIYNWLSILVRENNQRLGILKIHDTYIFELIVDSIRKMDIR